MSGRRDGLSWVLVALVLAGIGIAGYYLLWPQLQPHTTVRIGDAVFNMRVANDDASRAQGLSGTPTLAEGRGMLFVYDRDDKWGIWMKDMKYSIDIIWLDKDKKVVYMVKNAPPESYPYERFVPKYDSRYVIEVPAGTIAKKKIDIGQTAVFDENNIEGIKL